MIKSEEALVESMCGAEGVIGETVTENGEVRFRIYSPRKILFVDLPVELKTLAGFETALKTLKDRALQAT